MVGVLRELSGNIPVVSAKDAGGSYVVFVRSGWRPKDRVQSDLNFKVVSSEGGRDNGHEEQQ